MAEKKKTAGTSKKSTTETKAVKEKSTKTSAAPKKSSTKAAAPKSSTPRTKKANPGNPVSEEMRQHMIREAAYYRAQHRGFSGAAEMEDWLVAEREIDAMLGRLRA